MANSEDPDEMQHNAAFHQFLHCLLRFKLGTKIHDLEISTWDSLKYTMGSLILIVSICMGMGKSIRIQRIEVDHEIISTAILLPSADSKMCMKNWLTA